MIRFALRMLDSLKTFNARAHVQQGEPVFGLRIGINSGPIIAGVIGTKKVKKEESTHLFFVCFYSFYLFT